MEFLTGKVAKKNSFKFIYFMEDNSQKLSNDKFHISHKAIEKNFFKELIFQKFKQKHVFQFPQNVLFF